MTHDYNIGNGSGFDVRTDLNAVLSAILSQNSSATEPTVTMEGMFWYDTANSLLKQRNNANDAWLTKWDTTKGQLATLASPTFTGAVNLPSTTYLNGAAIAILNAPTFTGTATFANITASGTISLPASTSIGVVSATELGYLDGVTSNIQTQINSKQASGATLTALAGVTTGADKLIYATGADVFSTTTLTSFARTILDDSNGAQVYNTLGATQSFGTNGYIRLPNGLIIQWGATGAANGVFPIAFPSNCLNLVMQIDSSATGGFASGYVSVNSLTVSGFSSLYATHSRRYIAIGY